MACGRAKHWNGSFGKDDRKGLPYADGKPVPYDGWCRRGVEGAAPYGG